MSLAQPPAAPVEELVLRIALAVDGDPATTVVVIR